MQQSSGFNFGQPTTAVVSPLNASNNISAGATGFNFGSPNTTGTAGGLAFGSPNNASSALGGGLFSKTPSSATSTPIVLGLLNAQTPTTAAAAVGGTSLFGIGPSTTTNTTANLFGQTVATPKPGLFASPTSAASGSLFAQTSTVATGGMFLQPSPQVTGGLFAQTATPAAGAVLTQPSIPATGGLFAQTSTPAAGGLFAQSSTPAPGGLFAQSSTPAPGGLFSQTSAPATGGLFAQTPTPTAGSLFAQPTASAAGGLFSQSSTPATGGLFAPSSTPATGGLFAPSSAPVTGGLFAPSSAPVTGGLFAPSSVPATGGLFAPSAVPATGGLFAPSSVPATGGLFASSSVPATGGLFAPSSVPATGGLFASSTTPATGGLFAPSSTLATGLLIQSSVPATGGLFAQTATAATGGLFASASTPATSGLFSQPSAPTGLNLGVSNIATVPTPILGLGGSIPTTTSLAGLGGMQPATVDAVTANNSAKGDGKCAKEAPLPNDIFATISVFESYKDSEKKASEENVRQTAAPFHKLGDDTKKLRQHIIKLSNQHAQLHASARKLKSSVVQESENVEMARRTQETPIGLQGDNKSPELFFLRLIRSFEERMTFCKNKIDEVEKCSQTNGTSSGVTSEDMKVILKKEHEMIKLLAARVYTVHNQLLNHCNQMSSNIKPEALFKNQSHDVTDIGICISNSSILRPCIGDIDSGLHHFQSEQQRAKAVSMGVAPPVVLPLGQTTIPNLFGSSNQNQSSLFRIPEANNSSFGSSSLFGFNASNQTSSLNFGSGNTSGLNFGSGNNTTSVFGTPRPFGK